MKILVFEYITGGGFNRRDLPDALLDEGCLMLNALLANLQVLTAVSVVLMLDSRLQQRINTAQVTAVLMNPEHDSHAEFARLAAECDAVWPIAPEFDGILAGLCQQVEGLGKRLLCPSAYAVTIAGDKWLTYQQLLKHGIATVPTARFANQTLAFADGGQWLVKPVDGVACADSYVLCSEAELHAMRLRTGNYIIQPHLSGKTTSMSCLFKQGCAWLLCVNCQHFSLANNQYQLQAITVNDAVDLSPYQALLTAIAPAVPGLWGYVGIDLIETDGLVRVLEINPRLTTSFVGIQDALGINVAAQVLQLLDGDPSLIRTCNQAIALKVHNEP